MSGENGPVRGSHGPSGISFRSHLTGAMLLVIGIAILPSILAFGYLRSIERGAPASSALSDVGSPAVAGAERGGAAQSGAAPAGDSGAFTPAEHAARNTITFALVALLAGALVVAYTPVHLLKALGRLTAILKQAETGNLNVAIAGSHVREVSELAVAVNRTLGRLRHFDELKTRRIRDEQRVVEALFAGSPEPVALVSPQARIARRNQAFRELVENGEGDCSGRGVRDVMGDQVHEAVRRVQRDREVLVVDWAAADEVVYPVTLRPVKDEVDTPPRVLVVCEPPGGPRRDAAEVTEK